MNKIYVNLDGLNEKQRELSRIIREMGDIAQTVDDIKNNLDWDVKAENNINYRLNQAAKYVYALSEDAKGLLSAMEFAEQEYSLSEGYVISLVEGLRVDSLVEEQVNSIWDNIMDGIDNLSKFMEDHKIFKSFFTGIMQAGLGETFDFLLEMALKNDFNLALRKKLDDFANILDDLGDAGKAVINAGGEVVSGCKGFIDDIDSLGFKSALVKGGGTVAAFAKSIDLGDMFRTMGSNLKAGAREIATGSVVSLMFNGIENFDEYQAGEITASDAAKQTISDTLVDVAVGAAVVAVVGTGGVGLVVSVAAGVIMENVKINDKSLKDWASTGIIKVFDFVGDKVGDAVDGIGDALKDDDRRTIARPALA